MKKIIHSATEKYWRDCFCISKRKNENLSKELDELFSEKLREFIKKKNWKKLFTTRQQKYWREFWANVWCRKEKNENLSELDELYLVRDREYIEKKNWKKLFTPRQQNHWREIWATMSKRKKWKFLNQKNFRWKRENTTNWVLSETLEKFHFG